MKNGYYRSKKVPSNNVDSNHHQEYPSTSSRDSHHPSERRNDRNSDRYKPYSDREDRYSDSFKRDSRHSDYYRSRDYYRESSSSHRDGYKSKSSQEYHQYEREYTSHSSQEYKKPHGRDSSSHSFSRNLRDSRDLVRESSMDARDTRDYGKDRKKHIPKELEALRYSSQSLFSTSYKTLKSELDAQELEINKKIQSISFELFLKSWEVEKWEHQLQVLDESLENALAFTY